MQDFPSKVRIPYYLHNIVDEDFPEYSIVLWRFKHHFDMIRGLYRKKVEKKIFGGTKIYYQLIEIEYVPGFVGIKLGIFGHRDYDYLMEGNLEKRKIIPGSLSNFKPSNSAFYIFDMDTHETYLKTSFSEKPLNLKDHWSESWDKDDNIEL